MARKFMDENGLAYLVQKIKVWNNGKVDKVEGKSLIDNTELARLANVSNYDDSALQSAVNDKTTMAAVEAKGYQTSAQVQSAISSALSDMSGVSFSIVSELPASGESGIFYLVPKQGSGNDVYDEFIWVTDNNTSKFEKIGTTAVDLSGYMQTSDMVAITNNEIDNIVAAQ